MFETSRRPHPLHTFRFWFVIVAAGAVTLGWKLDLLHLHVGPAQTGRLAPDAFIEIDPAEELAPAPDEATPLPFEQSEPPLSVPTLVAAGTNATEAPHEFELADVSSPGRALPQTAQAPGSIRDDFLFAQQSGPRPTAAATQQQTASDNPFAFDEDEWPSGSPSTSTPTQQTSARPSTSANASGDDFPAAAPVVQTSATATAYETQDPSAAAPASPPASVETPLEPGAGPGVDFTRIDTLLATGVPADEIDAHRQLSTTYWKQPEARAALRERIDTLSQKIYFLNSRHYMDAYEVQPGDTLQEIARQYEVTWQYLARLNRVDPRKVRAGQRLKVIKGPFSAIVDLSDHELTIHAHGYFVTRYPVGIGKDGSSPIGKFAVLEKLVDPTYYGPDGVVNHDDPANPLGERWIDIGNSYGLHGTIDPASIGRSDSKGCIRLHNDDVAAVYDLLTIGSEVVIRP
jgi:hypothetical protein